MRGRKLRAAFAALVFGLCTVLTGSTAEAQQAASGKIKVFILAGDENVLEQASIDGVMEAVNADFYINAAPAKDEKKQLNADVYEGTLGADAGYSKLKLVSSGVMDVVDQRPQQPKRRKPADAPVQPPFPEASQKAGHVTVLRGFLSVPRTGQYTFQPGEGDGAFNVTKVDGKEAYRRETEDPAAAVTPVELEAGKRYAFETAFFKQPSIVFTATRKNAENALSTATAQNPEYAFLKDNTGAWVKRNDVVVYDAHPIHNNTKTGGHLLQVGDVVYGGDKPQNLIGPELMLGHVLGNHFEDPVLLVRFATRNSIGFLFGSRSLGHDYMPPSSGGTPEADGSWDVIHFNWGVWDAGWKETGSKYYVGPPGRHITSVEDYEQNLRTLVGKLKQTGATLIFATTTPVWKGEPGKENADVREFNRVAEKVMKENGVIINDLYSETLRQGRPQSNNVHDVGHLAPKALKAIEDALAARKTKTKPLPRVLLIGDSITGTYVGEVMQKLDGKAFVCMIPENGSSTWHGLRAIDRWINLKRYLLNGQEYLSLVANVKDALANLDRVYPEYKGQPVELAGLIWFQGLKDAGSDAMTAAYEKNLANLIEDLRKEFNAPKLPVVVGALPHNMGHVRNAKAIHDAQQAMVDPSKYPAFVGNVACFDSGKFYPAKPPAAGGRPQIFYSSAAAFLEIGKAMGERMLELHGTTPETTK